MSKNDKNNIASSKLKYTDAKNNKPVAVLNPGLINEENLWSFGKGVINSTALGAFKLSGFSINEVGLSNSSLRRSQPAAIYCFFGANADIANSHDTGLQKNVVKRIKQEQKQFIKALDSDGSVISGFCAGMQHILKFCFGVELSEYIPLKGENYKGVVGKVDHFTKGKINNHEIQSIDDNSLIAKALKKINNNNNITTVLASNRQGCYKKDIDLVNEDIAKTFDKPLFKLVVTAISQDNIVEAVEVRDINNKSIAFLTQFHPEWHQESKFSKLKQKTPVINKSDADIFSSAYMNALNDEVSINMQEEKNIFSKESAEQIKEYINIIKNKKKGIDSIKINDFTNNITDSFKKDIKETILSSNNDMNFEKNNNLACDIINNLQTRNKETSEVLDNLLHIIKNNIDKFKKGRC